MYSMCSMFAVILMLWSPDPTSQLALNALLERCKEVLAKFVHEERLSGQCPLPRYKWGWSEEELRGVV